MAEAREAPDDTRLTRIWHALCARLSDWDPSWRERVGPGAPADQAITNAHAFEAFATALVAGNTRWDRIEPIQHALHGPLCDFDPARYARLSDAAIEHDVLAWFHRHKAGSAGLAGRLRNLRDTAALLAGEGAFGSARAFFEAVLAEAHGSPERLAVLLGRPGKWKLPGFGIALAAEGLRLMGFDLCKPDRHVLRAVGAWNLVQFARWERRGPYTAPTARPPELLAAMLAVRALAEANGVATTYASSVVWTAGAVSGARLTNAEFAQLAD